MFLLAVEPFVEGSTTFALDLYRELSKDAAGDDNIFFSPFSISMALGMTSLGARANTAKEMAETMRLSGIADSDKHVAFQGIHKTLNQEGVPYTLKNANKLFVHKNYPLLESFLEDTRKFYEAEASLADFQDRLEESRQSINKWVEDQTAAKIKDLFPEGSIDNQTILVLVNAIYFKGDWTHKFQTSNTRNQKFVTDAGKNTKVDVDMMFQSEDFRLCASPELDCRVLEMPYGNRDLAMYILLPNSPGGLSKLEAQITSTNLTQALRSLRKKKVDAHIPKFKLDFGCSLNSTLSSLGMKDLFVPRAADLSGIDGSKNLYVSAAVHKAFIEVNEEGSEAAAATGIGIALMCMPIMEEFVARHPFMFMIRDTRSGALLFMGRLSNPGA